MQFNTTKFRVWNWKHPFMFHWIINPGVAFNEIILGQRVAKVILLERDNRKSFAEKTFIPCPHCETLHSGLKWTPQNNTAFGNWFGLYCDNCGKIIPCLTNFLSFIILMVTAPIWYWFKNRLQEKWLEQQRKKFAKPIILTQPKLKWWQVGLKFGVTLFLLMCFWDFIIEQQDFNWNEFLLQAVIYIVGAGLMFGGLMKGFISNSKSVTREQQSS